MEGCSRGLARARRHSHLLPTERAMASLSQGQVVRVMQVMRVMRVMIGAASWKGSHACLPGNLQGDLLEDLPGDLPQDLPGTHRAELATTPAPAARLGAMLSVYRFRSEASGLLQR